MTSRSRSARAAHQSSRPRARSPSKLTKPRERPYSWALKAALILGISDVAFADTSFAHRRHHRRLVGGLNLTAYSKLDDKSTISDIKEVIKKTLKVDGSRKSRRLPKKALDQISKYKHPSDKVDACAELICFMAMYPLDEDGVPGERQLKTRQDANFNWQLEYRIYHLLPLVSRKLLTEVEILMMIRDVYPKDTQEVQTTKTTIHLWNAQKLFFLFWCFEQDQYKSDYLTLTRVTQWVLGDDSYHHAYKAGLRADGKYSLPIYDPVSMVSFCKEHFGDFQEELSESRSDGNASTSKPGPVEWTNFLACSTFMKYKWKYSNRINVPLGDLHTCHALFMVTEHKRFKELTFEESIGSGVIVSDRGAWEDVTDLLHEILDCDVTPSRPQLSTLLVGDGKLNAEVFKQAYDSVVEALVSDS